ncbi:MAG: MFS transporter [Legionellales bacterium]|nr:MFS transporter [Legionellales bacterium]
MIGRILINEPIAVNSMASHFSSQEWRGIVAIAFVLACRMLGFFMILPVFIVYAEHYQSATLPLVGLAFGIYGLTQGLLQFPFGMLSDRFGRKRMINIGLSLSALGSLIAALTGNIYGLILGRAVQGSGAIGSILMALVADMTTPENRVRAMAIVGATIGLSFALAIIIGSAVSGWFGLQGIFWLTLALSLLSMLVLQLSIPHLPKTGASFVLNHHWLQHTLLNKTLWPFLSGIMIQHAIFAGCFFILPIVLQTTLQLSEPHHWLVYTPLFLGALLIIAPTIVYAQRQHRTLQVTRLAAAVIGATLFMLSMGYQQPVWLCLGLLLYLTSFTLLEATLPTLTANHSLRQYYGSTMGLFSSSQFLGIFIGGTLAGWLYSEFTASRLFFTCAMMAALWFGISFLIKGEAHGTGHQ